MENFLTFTLCYPGQDSMGTMLTLILINVDQSQITLMGGFPFRVPALNSLTKYFGGHEPELISTLKLIQHWRSCICVQ